MRIFVTGASGLVGLAVSKELISAGHQVVGLARSDANAKTLTEAGAEVFRGSLEDLDGLKRAAAAADGVVHTAFNHDFVNTSREAASAADLIAVQAMGSVLGTTNKPLVVSAGMSARSEDDAVAPDRPRRPSEEYTLTLKGVRGMVVRLPPTVHGDNDKAGLVPMLINFARKSGAAAYIGEGQNPWCAVHKTDAAKVYRLAIEKGVAGTSYHAVGEERIPTKTIAEAIARGLKLPAKSITAEEAKAQLGFLGYFFAADVSSSSQKTQERLGWKPTGKGLLQDLEEGTYFK